MKKIDCCVYSAPKLRGTGHIKYCLWVNTKGSLYVQIIENEESGTFSKYLFSVSKYESEINSDKALGELEVFNIETKKTKNVEDKNNGAFLKAILRNLLIDGESI